jgi:tetratricopeptide (TPR) repeat protein
VRADRYRQEVAAGRRLNTEREPVFTEHVCGVELQPAHTSFTAPPNLIDLLSAAISDESPHLHLEIGVAIIPKLGRSDHPVINWISERLFSEEFAADPTSTARLLITAARFHIANLLMHEDNASEANKLYTAALADCDPEVNEYGSILNNRGISLIDLDRPQAAIADFTSVIEAPSASDESRACALNNRADLLTENGDLDGAITDRSAVLQLADTTYNRRYIALIRRAIALRRRGDAVGALDDIATILATDDIAVEQKMSARLRRAEWLIEDGKSTEAHADLNVIIASRRNFTDVADNARRLSEQ